MTDTHAELKFGVLIADTDLGPDLNSIMAGEENIKTGFVRNPRRSATLPWHAK